MSTDTRDEVTAQRFRSRRLRAALLEGDPDSPGRPLARLSGGVYAGFLVTVLLLAVAGVYGVLRPGASTTWQQPGAFIVDDDTGARYLDREGTLHPVLNYASARLLLGDALHVVSVSSESLDQVPRGPMIGIPMAPDSLPDAARLTGTDWSVCAVGRAADGQAMAAEIRPGAAATGTVVDNDSGYLVATPAGDRYLIWSGSAHPIPDRWWEALGLTTLVPVTVDETFVAALPTGAPLAPPQIAGIGGAGPPLPGSVQPTPVGSVFADRTNAFYVMTTEGLAGLTPLQAQLLLADPALAAAYPGTTPTPLRLSQAQVAEAAPAPLPAPEDPAAPAQPPAVADLPPGEQQLCAVYQGPHPPTLVVGPAEESVGSAAAGDVRLDPGTGALIAPQQGPDSRGSVVYLVTDTGMRYPLSGQRALDQLGLADAPVAQLPPGLIDVLPQGPVLDPDAAGRTPG